MIIVAGNNYHRNKILNSHHKLSEDQTRSLAMTSIKGKEGQTIKELKEKYPHHKNTMNILKDGGY